MEKKRGKVLWAFLKDLRNQDEEYCRKMMKKSGNWTWNVNKKIFSSNSTCLHFETDIATFTALSSSSSILSLAPDTELNVFITWNVRKFSRECHQIYIEIISSRKNYVIYQIIKTIRRKLAEQARKNCQKTKRQPINNYYKIIIKVLYKQWKNR